MVKIGIYGGTFNPVHTGHIHAAKQTAEILGLDKLILIPDRIAPHKEIPSGSPTPEQRLEMLQLAVAGEEGIEVSDIELKREGKSFTYLTVEALAEEYPEAQLYLLMGTDMFLTFHTWRNPERITARATLAVMYRGEKGEREKIAACEAAMEQTGVRVDLVKNEIIPISSTQLRRLIAFDCAGQFLPDGVEGYIRAHKLYDSGADWKTFPWKSWSPSSFGC